MISILILFIFLSFSVFGSESPIPILFGSEDLLKKEIQNFIPEKKKDKKEKIPIHWGGSSLTQEERVVDGIPMKVFVLGGGAYITHKAVKLGAREIEIIGEDALIGNLKGQVIVEDIQNGVTLTAAKGVYNKILGTVTLDNQPILTQKKDNKIVKIRCQSIVRYLDDAKTVLSGTVTVVSEDFQVFGEDAVFFEKEDRIDLKGEPFLFSENRFLIGETLSYFVKEGSIQLDGNATIYQVSYESKKKKNNEEIDSKTETEPKERILSFFTGDTLTHLNKGKDTITTMNGNAFLYRLSSEFRANAIESKKNNKEIEAKGLVNYLDRENGYKMVGGFLSYDKEKGYSYLTDEPKILFLDKKTLEEKGNLSSVYIERFDEKKEMVARGDVAVETQTATAKGEFATYFEKEDQLVLEGNPSLTKDTTTVSAGKIIMYPKTDKVILTDGLKVIPSGSKN
ncbi:LptA/OstA family protein [Leptospira sp. 96542]|nr:LptA/OstA family protein [Leptospira sp. 96542]